MPCDWHDPSPLTLYRWVPQVRRQVHLVKAACPNVTANTYPCHPWRGWSRYSVDFWGPRGRGDALPEGVGPSIRALLMRQPEPPYIRHTIWEHELWTFTGGYSNWEPDDHSGCLRHLHVTYLK